MTEAEAEYRRESDRRAALVPERYRASGGAEFQLPRDAAEWQVRRPEVLRTVLSCLGDMPPLPTPPTVRCVAREARPGYVLEDLRLDNGVDGEISLLLLVPEKLSAPAPAVMWLHSSSYDKSQVLAPGTFWGEEPLGEALVRAGYVVCAPDSYWHGDREGTGPGGAAETGRAEQESLFKLHLWMGRTLWGMMVRDDRIVLDYLHGRPEFDSSRIGAVGMSLGSTRAWWLAALDERLCATAAIACLTRYRNLIDHGELRQHGIYYFVPGLLRHFDSEAVLALIAPRPLLALTGELDAGSPADGVRILERQVRGVYDALGAAERFRSVLYPGVGHTVTAEMRSEMWEWFGRWLAPAERSG